MVIATVPKTVVVKAACRFESYALRKIEEVALHG